MGKRPKQRNTDGASIVPADMGSDDSLTPATPFIDVARRSDEIVISDIPPSSSQRMISVDRFDR